MVKQFDTKFGWVIKDFSSLQSEKCYSVPVLISDCKWRLVAFPKGNKSGNLSLYLDVADSESLPCGWRRFVHIRLTIVNHFSQNLCILTEKKHCFGAKSTTCGFPAMFSLSTLHDKDGGFQVNGEVMIFEELDVFNVIGTLDASEKSEEASELVLKKTSPVDESNNVNGTKQVPNSVKTCPKNKRLWIAFLIFVFLLMVATGPKNS